MNGKITVLLLILGISYVAADGAKPAYWHGKGKWYGPSKPWNPVRPWPVYNELRLVDATTVTSIPAAGVAIAAGDAAVVWSTVTCPANGVGSADVGSCSWTGAYLADVPVGSGAGDVDWDLVCVLTAPCGNYGVGSITASGRGDGTNGAGAVDLAITGGTGAYTGLAGKGGVIEARAGVGGAYSYTFRFVR